MYCTCDLDSGRGRHQLNPYQDSLAETGSVVWLRKAAHIGRPSVSTEVEELGGRGVKQFIGVAHSCDRLGISDTFREPVP